MLQDFLCTMSANPLFANKKRENSILYGPGRAQVGSSLRIPQGVQSTNYDRSRYPPPKRHRAADVNYKAMDDPFDDNEDFTADDLEEIDILASQACTQDTAVTSIRNNYQQGKMVINNQSAYTLNSTKPQSSSHKKKEQQVSQKYEVELDVLQAHHEDLKHKLKELQDEVLVKNGEIKVLRDALCQTESNLEQQKITHVLMEKEKSQMQSVRERELNKKMQSLQSELEFKDAEMNELKTKLQNCERNNRTAVPVVSPQKSPSTSLKLEACSSPLAGRSNFPTKESFCSDMNLKIPPLISPQIGPRAPVISKEPEALPLSSKTFSSLFYAQRKNCQGSLLLNALMQQPKRPGSLGLCHLLCSSTEFLPGSPGRNSHTKNTSGTSCSSVLSAAQCSALRDAQKLSLTALNSIAVGEDMPYKRKSPIQGGLLHLNKLRPIAGAVHLLPLVEYHITAYCQAQQTFEKSVAGPSENQSMSSSRTDQSLASSVEDILSHLVEPALASLGILYHLVFYSLEVVSTLLKCTTHSSEAEEDSRTSKSNTDTVCDQNCDIQCLHSLFGKLIQLLCFNITTCHRGILHQTLRVLVKLAENSSTELLSSFQHLLKKPSLLLCLAAESPVSVAQMIVRLLAVLGDHQKLSSLFCSCSETCILLALYTYITSGPDKSASESLWLQLEHEVVRFLTKLSVIGSNPLITSSETVCQCNREVVKAVVLMLHREWLGLRRLSLHLLTVTKSKVVQFLRDAVLLLHSLSQKDRNFNEHCLEVLHQYDQALPGVRALFKKVQVLKENEEFALDELCPPEVETEDEYMDCT
ncbi:ATR interacting protein S homeolog isoform X2 [Xenopus laevis]|uniref:ATR interacting protein S homeolog isoform X2 n=1 Tax=Xenopus laevis TaxID=8355 RepID=A0A8J1MZP5_XENLA|nr:ATR interacting protein S homeolog isoform X2 [Xenopus laevis]